MKNPIPPRYRRYVNQFVWGFFVAWAIAITRGHIPDNQTYLVGVLALLPIGFLIGKSEPRPLLTAVLWNLGGFIVHSAFFSTGRPDMWPYTWPLLSVAPACACYLGIRLRQSLFSPGWQRVIWSGLTILLLIHSYIVMRWWFPMDSFNSYDQHIQTAVADIPLTGLHDSSDARLPLPGKQVVLIDFWNTRCGACYRLKPEIQALARKWQADPRVGFISVASALYDSLPGVRAARYLHVGDTTAIPEYFDASGELARRLAPEGCPVIALVDGQGVARLLHGAYDRATENVYREMMDDRISSLLAQGRYVAQAP
jgi:thiol-disulfide isomerase/thioredoxin